MRCLPPLALLVFVSSLPAADELPPIPSVAIDPRSLPTVPTDELRPLPFGTDIFGNEYTPTCECESRGVRNRAILDPMGALLAPLLATRLLGGQDYAEWCLRWNRIQDTLASQRAIPPRRLTGWVTDRRGFPWIGTVGRFYRSAGRQFYQSETRIREPVWYGGGPVTIYNPFVAPRKARD